MKQTYETITSIHLYSLSPTKVSDLVTLTDLGRSLYTDVFAKEDPLLNNETYGVIQNPQVRRRKGKRPIAPSVTASKFQPVKDEPVPKTASVPKAQPKASGIAASFNRSSSNLKKEDTTSRPSSRDSTSTAGAKPTLRRDASDIFKAFAKGKTKQRAGNDSQEADTPMSGLGDDDEGESEDEALFLDTGNKKPAKKRTSDVRKERDDKAAKLRKMMDSDDEEVSESNEVSQTEQEPSKVEDGDAKDAEAVDWSESDGEAKPKKAEPEEPAGPKRRRGKRKVMKKRTMKDEDGYLVTKEEEAWESFSETDDETQGKPEAKAAFGGFGSRNNSSQAAKGTQRSAPSAGKKAVTGGKKDIMSFFGKK
jgi:DNA polymerase delta subunit 3